MSLSVGFTGTQQGMSSEQIAELRAVLSRMVKESSDLFGQQPEFHHGDCIGADAQAHRVARSLGFRMIGHPPVNDSKRAWCEFDEVRPELDYIPRNHVIVDESNLLVAGPEDPHEEILRSGTWATVRYGRRQDIPVIVLGL